MCASTLTEAVGFTRPHLVLRGVYLPDTVRCTGGGDRFRPPSYTDTDSRSLIRGARAVNCYADVRVNAYVLGSGPSTLTVLVRKKLYWFSDDPDVVERLRLDIERVLSEGGDHARVSLPSGGITGREVILFIGPSVDMSIEAWRIFESWDVQRRDDDTVVAVHPHRDAWRVVSPDEYQAYRSVLEMELPAFTQAVTTANQVRVAEYGGRTGPDPSFPMLVTDANQLRQFFTAVGAYNHPDGPPAQPPPVSACATGTAVTSPGVNRGLVHDCGALLAAKDALRGTATLDWSVDTSITGWEGVTTGGTPRRVTELDLSSEGLTGSIPAGLGTLFELTTLDLSMNTLTGNIPAELGLLSNLEELRLSGNSLTGCIPLGLKDVATNDLSSPQPLPLLRASRA